MVYFLIATVLLTIQSAWAAPLLDLRVEIRNITGPEGVGQLSDPELRAGVEAANAVWHPCSLRFSAVSAQNISAQSLGVAYEPKSQDDLSRLASAIHPRGFDEVNAIPLTVAGPWRFYDPVSRLYLTGLGWVFTTPQGKLDRIGAMIDAQRLRLPVAGLLIAHELAHALSLPHVAEKDNLMGTGGTSRLSETQCQVAREFILSSLKAYLRP